MSPNILVTGAAGYIGGSIVADFLASNKFEKEQVIAAVRSEEQAEAMSELGINVLRPDLSNEKTVVESILRHDISIVIHTASSLDPGLALPLITALGKRREASGEQTYFIHTSGTSAFYQKTGWPAGTTEDTGPVFEREKQLADSFPIRKTDVAVIEHAKAQGVTSFIVVPCQVYGKGTGPWNRLSVVFPVVVRVSISTEIVHKFAENTKVSGVHISDLTALYQQIVEKILQKEAQTIPSGTEGYYFTLAHDILWWEVLDRLAAALNARGLTDSKTQLWASDEVAADLSDVPVEFVQTLWNSGEDIKSTKPYRLGWNPKWDKRRFLENIDDEIEAVLEHDKAKSSLIHSLFALARG